MKISVCLVSVFLFLSATLYSQQRMDTDSIKKLIQASKQDTAKINLYFQLTSDYLQNDTDSALYFLKKGKSIIDQKKAHRYDYDYYFTGIKIYHSTQEFDKALDFTNKALTIATKNKNNIQKAEALRTLFVIYLNLNKDTLAVQTAQKALKLTEEIKDTANLSIMYGNLSRLYYEIGSFEKSLLYGKKGIAAGRKYNNLKGLLISLNNTAIAYQELDKVKDAEGLFMELLRIAEKNDIPRSKVKALVNLINMNIRNANPARFNDYLNQLNKFLEENPDAPYAKSDLRKLPIFNASKYLFENNYSKAEDIMLKGLSKVADDEELIQSFYNTLTNINYAKHDFTRAQKFQLKSDSIQVILNKQDLTDFEAELSKKYETEKKENQIKLQQAELKQKNTLNYFLIGGTVALLLILLLFYRNYNHRKKLQQQRITELETEKQLLATQSLLKGQEEERSRMAKDLHDGLGGLLSGIKLQLGAMKGNLILTEENGLAFDRALIKLDESIGELRRVSHNMMPESLVKAGLKQAILDYCDSLAVNQSFTINCELHGIDQKLNNTTEVTLYRIIQELVNNAVKHSGASQILVQLFRHANGHFAITIEDNGIGFDINATDMMQSAGMRNIQSRVNYLKGSMDVKSEPGKGTSIFIECEDGNN
ncbi:MAG: histidine kinase [Flavobacterium sp.]